MLARDGGRFVRSNVRCACGVTLCERLVRVRSDDAGRCDVRHRFLCEQCGYLVWKASFDHGRTQLEDPRTGQARPVAKKDVVVLHHVCADTGALLPGEVEIFVWAVGALRDGSRGGVPLDPAHLTRALQARDAGYAPGRST